MVRLKNR